MQSTYLPDDVIYGLSTIAEFLGVSSSTGRRWLHRPEAACFSVGSMANAGGGYGFGWYGQVNSLAALKERMLERRSDQAAAAAHQRWGHRPMPTCDVSSSSVSSRSSQR